MKAFIFYAFVMGASMMGTYMLVDMAYNLGKIAGYLECSQQQDR